jgi:CRP/FNR family transcriptional regulator, cyclic AMP receptor protein
MRHKYVMKNVGPKANILKTSAKLKKSLLAAGVVEEFSPRQCLFEVDQENQGVYLVMKGKVRLYVRDYPRLDRIFSAGSLLGVPATFTGHPYSLGASAVTAAEVLHVGQKAFLDLMTQQPELCREAADLLSREVTFIQAALAERRRSKSLHPQELAAS